MKALSVSIGLAALVTAALYFNAQRSAVGSASLAPAVQTSRPDESAQSARLAGEIDELQRRLLALKTQVGAQQRELAARRTMPADDPKPDLQSVQEQRAADAERRREYMAGVAEAFSNERVDPNFAARTSTRVAAAFDRDEGLQGIAHTVECRQQTCRVQIDDDGSGTVSSRMPFIALHLADVLPAVSAEHIDQSNGRGALILYMSSQRPSPPTPGER